MFSFPAPATGGRIAGHDVRLDPVMSNLDLGLIGNCQVAVLVDRLGRYVWGAFPRFDSDPMFCSLLGGERDQVQRGFFDVEMSDMVASDQHYVENSAILVTTLRDRFGGVLRITDYAPRFRQYGRSFHPVMVVRTITPVSGSPAIRIRCRPAAGYGEKGAALTHGSNHISFVGGDFTVRVTTNASLAAVMEERTIVLDEPLSFVIGPDETLTSSPAKLAREMYGETLAYWQNWVRALHIPFEWQEAVIRAAITLKLCTYEDTGAVVAALTTSIPEAPDTGRTWDYRYCWLRDSFYTVQALNRLGATRTMESYLRYLFGVAADLEEDAELQPVFGISGETRLDEKHVAALPGYRGMGPVRTGNDAYRQRQNDAYGAIMLSATQYFFDRRIVRPGGRQEFDRLEPLGRRAAALYDQVDAGPWEFRGRQAVHTYSSAMCWAGCDRLARIAGRLGLDERARDWGATASRLKDEILQAAWSERRQSLVGSFGGDSLDASVLVLPDIGFIDARDPRFLSTVSTIEAELRNGPYLFRYAGEDDFGSPETAFNICTFWYINALAATGRREEARELYANMLDRRNSLGLLSEDIDPRSGELWGNFPQTYSMVGVIIGAMRLSRSWDEAI